MHSGWSQQGRICEGGREGQGESGRMAEKRHSSTEKSRRMEGTEPRRAPVKFGFVQTLLPPVCGIALCLCPFQCRGFSLIAAPMVGHEGFHSTPCMHTMHIAASWITKPSSSHAEAVTSNSASPISTSSFVNGNSQMSAYLEGGCELAEIVCVGGKLLAQAWCHPMRSRAERKRLSKQPVIASPPILSFHVPGFN